MRSPAGHTDEIAPAPPAIAIVPFRREFAPAFRQLNLEWIERWFAIEAPDLKVLDDPETAIIAPGGQIFFALDGSTAVGTVAILRAGDRCYELAKMAVADAHRRRGIGDRLGAAAIGFARDAGAERVFLLTNSRLANAIRLYERLGFQHRPNPHPASYVRADVYMELPFGGSRS